MVMGLLAAFFRRTMGYRHGHKTHFLSKTRLAIYDTWE
jgi:hypothetical protein